MHSGHNSALAEPQAGAASLEATPRQHNRRSGPAAPSDVRPRQRRPPPGQKTKRRRAAKMQPQARDWRLAEWQKGKNEGRGARGTAKGKEDCERQEEGPTPLPRAYSGRGPPKGGQRKRRDPRALHEAVRLTSAAPKLAPESHDREGEPGQPPATIAPSGSRPRGHVAKACVASKRAQAVGRHSKRAPKRKRGEELEPSAVVSRRQG